MKYKKSMVLCFMAMGCSTTHLITDWKNPDYDTYTPNKILVVGVTPNYEVRKTFEFALIKELNARGINALQSAVVFASSFQDSKQTEPDIKAQVEKLISKGYDAVLVSLVKGVDDKVAYASESPKTDYHLRHFILYYLAYQEAYFNQDYYVSYKVFNIETSIYNLKKESDKSLVWQGTFDLIDPNSSKSAIRSYIKTLFKTLEKEKLIPKKLQKEDASQAL